jgi:adenylate cyclase
MTGRILVVDDQLHNRTLLCDLVRLDGHSAVTVDSGDAALALLAEQTFDLVLLDVLMPGKDGFAVLREIRANSALSQLPIVLCTSLDPDHERVRGLEAGADDFLQKPINRAELSARVKSLLRVKQLFDQVEQQRDELQAWSVELERRVTEKVSEVAQLSRLKRFFSASVAKKILLGDADDPMASHRRDVAVVFVDLRGFTAFAEAAAPEDVMRILSEFHHSVGHCIDESGGTIERFTGDGVMVFFNDPEPIENPCRAALQFSQAVRNGCAVLSSRWAAEGFSLTVGIGVAYGFATLGAIGYSGRIDYGAIGSVTNMAARLCAEAKHGEVLVQQRALALAGAGFSADAGSALALRGFREPVVASKLLPTLTLPA